MPCLILLILPFLPVVFSVVTLQVASEAIVSTPISVQWLRDKGDPRVFDLRIVKNGVDIMAANVQAERGVRNGTTSVTFPAQGLFVLKAIDYENNDTTIATSPSVNVIRGPLGTPSTTISTSGEPPSGTTTEPTGESNPTKTPGSTLAPVGGSSKTHSKAPAIIGGIVGGLILLGILIVIAVILKRRRDKVQKRLTFHRDLMIQHRPMPGDLERGPGMARSPALLPSSFQHPITVSTPARPTRPQFPLSAIAMPVPGVPPTDRQTQLDNRVDHIEQRISRIKRQNRGQAGMESVIGQMQKQVEWLKIQRDSPWARGETNVPPPQLDLYWE